MGVGAGETGPRSGSGEGSVKGGEEIGFSRRSLRLGVGGVKESPLRAWLHFSRGTSDRDTEVLSGVPMSPVSSEGSSSMEQVWLAGALLGGPRPDISTVSVLLVVTTVEVGAVD